MLREAGIEVLADVRRFAGSRHNPQFSRDAMPAALAAGGVEYAAFPGLGGRRKAAAGSPNGAWRVEAFRAYADHMATQEYVEARDRLMAIAQARRTCVMCAEAVWWRCHRRLVADDFTAHGWQVVHLMAPGKSVVHILNPAAVMLDGVLRYPGPSSGSRGGA